MNKEKLYIEGIGEGVLKFSKRAHKIYIRVKPFVGLTVTAPAGINYSIVETFINKNRKWILGHLNSAKEIENSRTIFDENTDYKTKYHELIIKKSDRKDIFVRVSNGKIKVAYPLKQTTDSRELQSAVKKGIERALGIEAKKYLPEKVKLLAEEFNFGYNKIRLKNMKSRWGSCSGNKNINLNIHLMLLPEHLIRYVILHELVHTVHLNHSKNFWELLDKITGGAKKLDKELNKFRAEIY